MVDIMKKKIILSVCAVVAMAFSLPSQAQRLIPKQRGIEVVASAPLIKGEKFLAADNFGMGTSLTRYWDVRIILLLWQSMNSRIFRTEIIT